MYCTNCGKSIGEQNFCQHCGARVAKEELASSEQSPTVATGIPGASMPVYATYTDRTQQRQYELDVMQKLLGHFSLKIPQYNEYDQVSYRINQLSRGSSQAALIWGIIVSGIALVMGAIASADREALPAFFIFLIIAILLYALHIRGKRKNKKQLAQAIDRYYELNEELYAHYCRYENCPIGPEYTNPANLQVIRQTIISGRADTIKEALNILVEDAHRERMEDLSARTAQYAQQAAASAAETAARAGQTARNTSVTAFFTAADYFKR